MRVLIFDVSNVSVLFNEPKLLKSYRKKRRRCVVTRFSALQRAEIAEMYTDPDAATEAHLVSVLFNEPKLLKLGQRAGVEPLRNKVSVLFNEPKLLKCLRSSSTAVRTG